MNATEEKFIDSTLDIICDNLDKNKNLVRQAMVAAYTAGKAEGLKEAANALAAPIANPSGLRGEWPSRRKLTVAENALAKVLRQELAASGLTQEEAAARMGITQGAIWQHISGHIGSSTKFVVDFRAALEHHHKESAC
jgi:predicted DNA-binding protein (UPF0251 family)